MWNWSYVLIAYALIWAVLVGCAVYLHETSTERVSLLPQRSPEDES